MRDPQRALFFDRSADLPSGQPQNPRRLRMGYATEIMIFADEWRDLTAYTIDELPNSMLM